MYFKEQSKAFSGTDLYVACAPDEYFMFMLLFAFTEYGFKVDVGLGLEKSLLYSTNPAMESDRVSLGWWQTRRSEISLPTSWT